LGGSCGAFLIGLRLSLRGRGLALKGLRLKPLLL
jgi:hypothetical protein